MIRIPIRIFIVEFAFLSFAMLPLHGTSQTVALWLFDEQRGLYPSCVLNDSSESDFPLVLGRGGQIVEGKFGNALEPLSQPEVQIPLGQVKFGLTPMAIPEGRTVEPMTWFNADFCALSTIGENHLWKYVGFADPTDTRLNLGAFDWTVEFWYRPTRLSNAKGVMFEIGEGPRGENERITRLLCHPEGKGFTFVNQPSGARIRIPSERNALEFESGQWHHFAFVYSVEEKQLRHYLDGALQDLPEKASLRALERGTEGYFSIGRDGLWQRPLQGRLDELRFSTGQVYSSNFTPPDSVPPLSEKQIEARLRRPRLKGPPLLFDGEQIDGRIVPLGGRKHLFIDDAIIDDSNGITFSINPPRRIEKVIDNIGGSFRKHLSVLEDEDGLIRLYNGTEDDALAVRTSRDGIHWEEPDLGRGEYRGRRNIVIPEPVGTGTVLIDPNAPPEERWKYISGFHDRGIYLYSSPDGWSFKRQRTSVLPFRSASQSTVYYDDQRQLYVGHHRSDSAATLSGKTQREFVLTEVWDILAPWPFRPVDMTETVEAAKTKRLKRIKPWYLDNGPLTPGGIGIEYPRIFAPDDSFDPVGTDIYVPKAIKYTWAPDTYLAFPLLYFHYWGDGPMTRQILGAEERGRGSGPIECQLAVSRDGKTWRRYPRPAYIGIGRYGGLDVHQVYMAQGLVRRGEEIWQYFYGTFAYHSKWHEGSLPSALYRVVQRLDGFVSADSSYDRLGTMRTRPITFEGNRLVLNIDTEATGYAQVGILDETGEPIEGFALDECVYINGDFIETTVEWIKSGEDLSSLSGKVVQLEFRMRGSKLYAMQFAER